MARDLISVKIDDRQVAAALDRLIAKADNFRPALKEIGEDLMESTKMRFGTSTAPDGSKWKSNSPVTISRFVHGVKGTKTKGGDLLKRGQERLGSKKPLIGVSKQLSHTIAWQLRGSHNLLVGSPLIYASTQQFGAEAGEFGTNKRGGKIPWGDIPARPFLGISESDRAKILAVVGKYLSP